jgi:hypothetical protein
MRLFLGTIAMKEFLLGYAVGVGMMLIVFVLFIKAKRGSDNE